MRLITIKHVLLLAVVLVSVSLVFIHDDSDLDSYKSFTQEAGVLKKQEELDNISLSPAVIAEIERLGMTEKVKPYLDQLTKDQTLISKEVNIYDIYEKFGLGSTSVKEERYPSGALKAEIPMREKKPHGLTKKYFETGELWFEIPYIHGQITGTKKTYYKNGQIHHEQHYQGNRQVGLHKTYYKSGDIQVESTYDDTGVTRSVIGYYQSGQIASILKYGENNNVVEDRKFSKSGEEISLQEALKIYQEEKRSQSK